MRLKLRISAENVRIERRKRRRNCMERVLCRPTPQRELCSGRCEPTSTVEMSRYVDGPPNIWQRCRHSRRWRTFPLCVSFIQNGSVGKRRIHHVFSAAIKCLPDFCRSTECLFTQKNRLFWFGFGVVWRDASRGWPECVSDFISPKSPKCRLFIQVRRHSDTDTRKKRRKKTTFPDTRGRHIGAASTITIMSNSLGVRCDCISQILIWFLMTDWLSPEWRTTKTLNASSNSIDGARQSPMRHANTHTFKCSARPFRNEEITKFYGFYAFAGNFCRRQRCNCRSNLAPSSANATVVDQRLWRRRLWRRRNLKHELATKQEIIHESNCRKECFMKFVFLWAI